MWWSGRVWGCGVQMKPRSTASRKKITKHKNNVPYASTKLQLTQREDTGVKTLETQITTSASSGLCCPLSGSGQGPFPPRHAPPPCGSHRPAHAEDPLLLHASTAGQGGRDGESALQRTVQRTQRGGSPRKCVPICTDTHEIRTNSYGFLQIPIDSYKFVQISTNSYKYT